MSDSQTLGEYAAGEIRAMLARHRMTGRQLAQRLGVSRSWVSYRLTGTTEITLTDLQRIAEALEVDFRDLLPRSVHSGGSDRLAYPTPRRQAMAPRSVDLLPHPQTVDPPRPDGDPQHGQDPTTPREHRRPAIALHQCGGTA